MEQKNPIHEIKKCISFVFIKNDKNEIVANGTGFFVSVANELNKEAHHVYFASAKHVLKDKDGKYFEEIYIRLNKKEADSEFIKIELKNVTIFEHTDNDVDIAVFNCLPDINVHDFKTIPSEMFATDQKIRENDISEGDDVFFTGLFTSHVGQKRSQPIVRFGKLALLPEEKIEWKEAGKNPKMLDLFLMEAQSFGGNSGSPVFFNLSPMRKPGVISFGGNNLLLAGLVSGSFLSGNKIQVTDTMPNLVSMENLGICAVVPAQKLNDILFDPKLIDSRNSNQIIK